MGSTADSDTNYGMIDSPTRLSPHEEKLWVSIKLQSEINTEMSDGQIGKASFKRGGASGDSHAASPQQVPTALHLRAAERAEPSHVRVRHQAC